MEFRNSLLESNLNLINTVSEFVNTHFDNETKNVQLTTLEKLVIKYCELDDKWEEFNQVRNHISPESDENVFDIYKNRKTILRKSFNKHSFLRTFREHYSSDTGVQNSGIVINGQSFKPIIDPITQKYITNPLRNKICGHIYEDGPIQEIITSKKQIRCPYIGCAINDFVTLKNLELDVETAKKINEYNTKQPFISNE